jgi:hypothetical protein
MLWEFIVAFVLAGTPWLELLVVIPMGLAWGLPPVPLAVVVFAGNTATVLPLLWLHGHWRRWRARRRRRHPGEADPADPAQAVAENPHPAQPGRENPHPAQVGPENADAAQVGPENADAAQVGPENADAAQVGPWQPKSRRGRWAQRLWNRYGLPGLALLAPLLTGVHLAVVLALLSGVPRRSILSWMIGSMVLWTIAVTVTTHYGLEGLRWLWR